jgi:SAM-dependent methyltransferase
MHERLLEFLRCPQSGSSDFELHVFEKDADHVIDGVLRVRGSGLCYPIVAGVPRMLPRELFSDITFETRHGARLRALGYEPPAPVGADPFIALKQATSSVYGFEWTHWNRHGWTPDGPPLAAEIETFHHKSMLAPEELARRVVLDAGAGNGRYAYTAAQYSGELIALDLSRAVDAAFRNLRQLPNAHVVQGDILNPPFVAGSIDHVYSIGVLMITGNAELAVERLGKLVKPGGTLTAHVYAPGTPVWQLNDALVRRLTTLLSIPANVKLAEVMARAARWLNARRWLGYSSHVLRMWPEEVVNFDWYATPKQTYHTHAEMRGWFERLGWAVVADHSARGEVPGSALRKAWVRAVWPDPMATVKGRRPLEAVAPAPAASDTRKAWPLSPSA